MRARAFLLALLWAGPAEAAVRSVTLEKPARDFGYFLGDTVSATARVVTDPGTVLDRSTLPAVGPISGTLDIRRVGVEAGWAGGARVWRIGVEYQNFYPPDAAVHVPVPGYSLVFSDGEARFAASVPGWQILVSPLRHALTPMTDVRGLRPDHGLAAAPDARYRRGLLASALVALGALLVLLLGRFGQGISRQARPFRDAARQISELGSGDGAVRSAMLALHRAFDMTAGQAVLAQDAAAFVRAHPQFGSLAPEIERFFGVSARFFYGMEASDAEIAWLAGLGHDLARAERG